jgi:hypothetical protein
LGKLSEESILAANPEQIAPGTEQESWRNGLAVMNAGKPLAALAGETEPLLARLNSGESATEIAASLGIHHTALYAYLIRHCPEQWQHLSAARQLARLDQCEQTFDDASADGVTISRVREKAKLAQWHLERANRKLFGQDRDSQSGMSVTVIVQRDQVDTECKPVLTITQEK